MKGPSGSNPISHSESGSHASNKGQALHEGNHVRVSLSKHDKAKTILTQPHLKVIVYFQKPLSGNSDDISSGLLCIGSKATIQTAKIRLVRIIRGYGLLNPKLYWVTV